MTSHAPSVHLPCSNPHTVRDERPRRPTLRRVGALLAGVVTVVVLSHATDALLHAIGVFPAYGEAMADSLFVLALVYRSAYGAAAGYLVARLAPSQPMAHALVLGCIGLFVGLAGAVATWNAGPAFGPRWYALLVAITALPCALFGARLLRTRAR